MTATNPADPVLAAAEDRAARLHTMLGYPQRDRGYRLIVDDFAAFLRESGAVCEVDDESPFCRPRVTWPGREVPYEPTDRGAVALGWGLVATIAFFSGMAARAWLLA